jgi:hypothetical protein
MAADHWQVKLGVTGGWAFAAGGGLLFCLQLFDAFPPLCEGEFCEPPDWF